MNGRQGWISLSAALSWLTFGVYLSREELRRRLAHSDYSSSTTKELRGSLEKLLTLGSDALVPFRGEYVNKLDKEISNNIAATIPPVHLITFRAFDITTDGLRCSEGLLWLPDDGHETPDEKDEDRGKYLSSVARFTRPDHYVKVTIDADCLKKYAQAGRSGVDLPDAELKRWWSALSPAETAMSEDAHASMLKNAFPSHHVTRHKLRGVRAGLPRQRGRPKNSP